MFFPRNISAEKTFHTPTDYYPAFDYLRAAAAFGVFLSHSQFSHLLPHQFGGACVQVFFALSGYLIGGILLRTPSKELPRFFFNRSTRIWVPYWIAIGIIFLVTMLKQGLGDLKFFEFFFYDISFVYNWFGPPQLAEFANRMPLNGTGNHFWSICVEEQFYLFAPFVLVFVPRTAAVISLALLVAINFLHPHDFAGISLGVLLAMLVERRLFVGAAFGLAAAAAIWAGLRYGQWMPFAAASIVALTSWQSPQRASGRILGGASYPFYLNSWIGLFIAHSLERRFSVPSIGAFAVALTISGSLSIAHYWFIDREIAARRSQYFSRSVGITCCAAGLALVTIGLAVGLFLSGSPLN